MPHHRPHRPRQGAGQGGYGVLRGHPVEMRTEPDDPTSPHVQIRIEAADETWRIAVNVKSSVRRGEGERSSILLHRAIDGFDHPLLDRVRDVAAGFTPLAPRPDSGALDFIRGNLFDPQDMTLLPPTDEDGSGRDLNDLLAGFVNPAIADRGAEIFAFGTPWGPEENADKVFGFAPGRGIHNIHMNQGNPRGFHDEDNGVWHDGGLLIRFPRTERWVAVFLAFQSQAWHTDDRTGDALPGSTGPEARRFDPTTFRPAPPEAQPAPVVTLAAARRGGPAPAVLLLNGTGADVALDGWALAGGTGARQPLAGRLPGGGTLEVPVTETLLPAGGGIVSLLDAAGLKVDGAAYRAADLARGGWTQLG